MTALPRPDALISISEASPEKRGRRRGRPRDDGIRDDLAAIVATAAPCTVRQASYRATVQGIIPKTEAGYDKVGRLLVELRLEGAIPWESIADNTRWMRKPPTYQSLELAADRWAASYRRDMFDAYGERIEVWIEKDALAGVIVPVTERWDIPLMVTRGYASLSSLHTAAETIKAWGNGGVPTTIYYLGDHDPSGREIDRAVEERLRQFAPDTYLNLERIAVTVDQIHDWALPSRPTKESDSRARTFKGASAELDAIEPHVLRRLVEAAITSHVDEREVARLRVIEEEERASIRTFADAMRGRS